MKPLFLGVTAVLACPAIVVFLLLSWRFSWLARTPSLPCMLASIVLSAWCVFVVKSLASIRNPSGISEDMPRETRTRVVADKIGMVLVAIGILWVLFLGLSTNETLAMFRTTGVVDKIENGRAEVSFNLLNGNRAGYDFPVFDNFSTLHAGESISLLNEWKTTEVASRTWVFTVLGAATGLLLISGGLLARRPSSRRPMMVPLMSQ